MRAVKVGEAVDTQSVVYVIDDDISMREDRKSVV